MILGVVVGLEAEAVLARRLGPRVRVEVGGATASGAGRAAGALVAGGATHLLSFGLAGGLDPALPPGAALVPERVLVGSDAFACSPGLRDRLGTGAPSSLLHSDALVADAGEKRRLFAATGCAALDMESGAVARAARTAGVPFAVLRAVCDPAGRTLPPAARIPLRPDGRLRAGALAASILRDPWQLPPLLALGRDAGLARRTLSNRIDALARVLTNV